MLISNRFIYSIRIGMKQAAFDFINKLKLLCDKEFTEFFLIQIPKFGWYFEPTDKLMMLS